MRAFAILIGVLSASAIAAPCDSCSFITGDGFSVGEDDWDQTSAAGSDSGGSSFDWSIGNKGAIKGVNLGGWLVLEPWITPSLFKSDAYIDEYTFSQKNPNAKSQLKKHWKSFITKDDIAAIADAGFNHIRIPIGYWAFKKTPTDPFIPGAATYLDKAIKWAASSNLAVLIDLHGAPGSQNGFDNSGQKTANATWTRGDNIEHTLEVLHIIGKRYGSNPTVSAIGLLNEPFPEKLGYPEQTRGQVVNFHNCGAKVVRKASGNEGLGVAISDAFTNAFKWNEEYVETGTGANIIDHHDYQVFDENLLVLNLTAHLTQVTLDITASTANSTHPTIIGEFSGALTDCAKYLNGRAEGARYENKFSQPNGPKVNGTCPKGENSFAEFKKDKALKKNTTEFLAEQVKVFGGSGVGWFFWTWKTESAPVWDAKFLVEEKVFPKLS